MINAKKAQVLTRNSKPYETYRRLSEISKKIKKSAAAGETYINVHYDENEEAIMASDILILREQGYKCAVDTSGSFIIILKVDWSENDETTKIKAVC